MLIHLQPPTAAGCELFTTDGKRYLDITSGIGVTSTGHCHPTVVEAVQKQATKITHAQQSCLYADIQIELAKRLTTVSP